MRDRSGARDRKEARPANTHMGVQWEVEVPPELLNGTATPVLKHMQVGAAPELCGAEKQAGECARPGTGSAPCCPAAGGGRVERRHPGPCSPSPGVPLATEGSLQSHPSLTPTAFLQPHPHCPAPRPGCFRPYFVCARMRAGACTHACCTGSFHAGRGLV